MLRIAIGILTLLFTLSEGRFFGSHTDNMLESQNAVDIAPVRDFSQHEYKGYIYHEGDEAHDNSTNAISGAQMIIRKKIAASLRTHFGKLQSVLTAFADDDGFVREGIVFCGAGRDESGELLTEPDMPTEFHEEGARLIEYDGWGVVDAGKQAAVDQYDSVQCGKNNCNEGSAVASIANEIRASGYQIHHKDICEAKAVSVELSARSANMKPYGETKAIVCEKPFWYERLTDCIGVATDDGGDGAIDCGAKCEIAADTDGEYEDKMCWVNYTAINGGNPAGVGCYEAGEAPDTVAGHEAINAKAAENIAAETSINGIRRAMRYSLSGEVSVQTTDYAYFTGCKSGECLSLRQMFAALNGNAQISAFRDLGMEEASAYWSDQIKSIKTYLQSLADTFTDFRPHSIDIFPFIENEEIVGCPMGEIAHATGETGSDTQPLCYELAMTKTKLNEQSRDGQFISRGECVCRNGPLSDDITNITTDTTELDITSEVEADYIYLYYDMPSSIDCATLPTSVQTYCNSADWHGGDWEETLLALIPSATTTRTKIFPKHSINGIATTHAERELEISTRRQAIEDALTNTLPATLDTSCGRIINADSGVRSGAKALLVSNKGGNCFPFPKMHEIFFRLEFETSEQGTGSYNGANVLTGLPLGDKLDQRFCAEKVADIELSFRQLAYRFKNSATANKGQQLKNDDDFSGSATSTDLDYLVYTNENTTDSSGNEVARPFCVVNWLQEFGVRKLEDSSGKLYDDPFELQRSEVDEAVFNTELAQSTKSKVITDNILIWKAIRKELTTASDGNILDDIAQRAAQHYLYVVSTDEDLITPFVTYREAERVAEEVANFTVQASELNIEVKADKAAVASSIESALAATDETAAAQIAEDLVQGLLDYLEGMTNANVPARRRLHSSRKLASGDLLPFLSDPNMVSGVATCDQHFGYSHPGNCEQLTYYKYTGKGCFDSYGNEVPRYTSTHAPNMAHYYKSYCEPTHYWVGDPHPNVDWPIDNGFDPYSNYWTSGNDLGEENPSKFVWKSSAGEQPASPAYQDWQTESGLANVRKFRDPANYELQVNSTGTYESVGVRSLPDCAYQDDHGNFLDGLDGVSRYGAIGGTDSCYLGSGHYQQGCIFVPVTVSSSAKGACIDCAKKDGGYHYTGGNSGQGKYEAACTDYSQSNPCVQATSVAKGGGGCPDTSDCTECFAASKLDSQTLDANWATAIGELEAIKDAVTENTIQCQYSFAATQNVNVLPSCDQNNEGYFWQTTGTTRANVVNIDYPTRVNRTEYFKDEIIARAYSAFTALTASISNDLNTIAAYANNKNHAQRENEAQTKSDIEAKINSLHAEGKTLQDNLKDSFKFLKEYKTNYQRNEEFWKDTTEVAWPSKQTYYTQTDLSEALVGDDAATRAAPVVQQKFKLLNFPTQNDLKTACQTKIATAFYIVENARPADPKYGSGYDDLAAEYNTAVTNANGTYNDAAVAAGFANEAKFLGDLVEVCSDTTLAAQYGNDQADNDQRESDCITAFPFGNSLPCYEQRQAKIARDDANTDYLAIADATATTLTVHIKSYQEGITLSQLAENAAYHLDVATAKTAINAEFATLAGIAGSNSQGLTISELPDHDDNNWAAMSIGEKFTYKLTDVAKTLRNGCIANRNAAKEIMKAATSQLGWALGVSSNACNTTCTTSDVSNLLDQIDDHVLIGVETDTTLTKINAFKKILADLKAINVDPDCYVKNKAAIETTLGKLSAGAAGLKNIKIIAHDDNSNVYGNAYYEVDCWTGYTATNLECVRDACGANEYAVTAAHAAKKYPKVTSSATDASTNGPNPTNLWQQDGTSQTSKPAAKDGGDAYCEGCPVGMEGKPTLQDGERICRACGAASSGSMGDLNTYSDEIGTACKSVSPGSKPNDGNALGLSRGPTAEIQCSKGMYQKSLAGYANECRDCEAGFYSATPGASGSCTALLPGQYAQTTAGGTFGATLTKGTHSADCPKGTYANGKDDLDSSTGDCTECSAGRAAENTMSSECVNCPAGKYGATGSASSDAVVTGATQCNDVEVGYIQGESIVANRLYTKRTACTATKEYSDEPGLASCKTCQAGSVVTKTGSLHTGCTACDGSQDIYCDGATNITCGVGGSGAGEWNDDDDASTPCVPKTCQCGAGDALKLFVSNHVKDAEGNWQAFAVTGSGIAASGDKCPSGDSTSADSIYCTECDSTSGLYLLKDASGNVKTWTDSTGAVHNITVCHVCQEPYHSNSTGNHQSECSVKTCPIGEGYPTSLSADFSNLPDQFGQSDVLSCAQCDVGRFSEVSGVGGCFRMGSGYECETRLGTEGYDHTAAAKLGCSERVACAGGSYKFDEDMAGISKLSQTCNKINAGFYCNAIAGSSESEAGALLLSVNTVHVDPEPFGVCEEKEASRRRLDFSDYNDDAPSPAPSGGNNGGETHETAYHPCERIHDSTRCERGVYNPTTNTKYDCTWTDTSSNPGLHAASTALTNAPGCAMEGACPVGYYSNKGDGYCQKIPDGHRCKKARAADMMCSSPDQVIGAGTVMQTYCGVYDTTTSSWDWQYLTHGGDANGDHDLSDINSQAIELGCAETEKCPAGTWSNTGDYNCLDIPAGQKCSANVDGTAITETSVGCKEVVDCGSLEYSAEKTNLCQEFSGCPKGERVITAGVSGGVTWDSAGKRTDLAGSDNTCEACVAALPTNSSNGFNADDDDGSAVTDCTAWTGCADGEALNTYVGDATKDNGACHDCNNNYARLYASASSKGLTATSCVTADACLQNGEKPINCTDFACPCGTCDAGQSGLSGVCTDCVPGKYSATAGNGTCDLCPANEYQDTAKQTSCTSYEKGVGCKSRIDPSETTKGCKEIEDCPAGKYSGASDSECIDIPDGYECATLASGSSDIDADSTKCASIDRCPSGEYSQGSNICTLIPAGTKCVAAADDDGTAVTVSATSTGCKSIQGCDSSKFSTVGSNLCSAFPACDAGTYVKEAPGGTASDGGTDPGYTSDRDCELCSATGNYYRSVGPAITRLTVETGVCVACGTCSGGTPVVKTACADTAATVCRGVQTGDCTGSNCDNGVTDCPSDGGTKTCGSCHQGYALTGTGTVKTCDAITCACTDGTAVVTSERNSGDSGGNDDDTCLNSATENCESCDSGFRHDIYGGGNAKECNAYSCSCPNGVAKTGSDCTSIASEDNDCQSCNADYEHVDGTFTKADNSKNKVCDPCDAHEYAVAGVDTACAAKSFVCINGTPEDDATSVNVHSGFAHNAENCVKCDANYYLDSDKKCKVCGTGKHTAAGNTDTSCTQNTCSCTNGIAATFTACTTNNTEICTSCTAGLSTGGGYELVNSACVACETGEISDGTAAGNGCQDKQCTCTNGASGDGATGTACTTDGTDICKSNPTCASGYVKSEDSTTTPSTWTCVKQCTCNNGAGATGTACYAAGTQDCASCDSGYGRYLKEGAATSDEIHVCTLCAGFGAAFSDAVNAGEASATYCALNSCPLGQGYNMPSDLDSTTFDLYLAEFEVNTFRGATLISTGEFKCTDCPADQYSDDDKKGQCEAIPNGMECRDDVTTGCEEVCTAIDFTKEYNTDCTIKSCDSGYEEHNGACVAVCTNDQYRDGNGDCIGKCPATASGGTGNEAFTGICSSVQDGNTCAVDCTHTDRNNDDGVVTCTAGTGSTAGTWGTLDAGTCLLNTGKVCGGAAECADDYCYDGDSDSSDKECYASAQTCDGTSVTWANATRRTTAQGGGGSANDPLTATEADESTIIFRCTYGATAGAAHATNTFTCSSGTFTGDGTAACPTSPPPPPPPRL